MKEKFILHGIALGLSLLSAGRAFAQNLVVSTIISNPTPAGIHPAGLAVDAGGNLYFADPTNAVIERISPTGVLQLLAGQPGVTGNTDGPAASALFSQPTGIALDSSGNIFVADPGNSTIRKITPAGIVSTLAGIPGTVGHQNGVGSSATFNAPAALAVDVTGNVYVADGANESVRKIDPSGQVSTLAQIPTPQHNLQGIALDRSGNIFVTSGAFNGITVAFDVFASTIYEVSPAGAVSLYAGQYTMLGATDGPVSQALFFDPVGLAVDAAGDLFIADMSNKNIREITPAGVVTTVAGTTSSPGLVDGSIGQARFNAPQGIAVDAYGNVFISDGQAVRRGIPSANTQSPIRLVNLSARGTVTPSAPLIGGFVVEGTTAQTVLVRAVGPTLAQYGVSSPLGSAQLDIYNHAGVLIASSAAGINTTNSGSAAALTGAFPLPPGLGDAPLVITLKPGTYTAVVSSPNGGTGTALVEVYEVP